MSDHLQKLYIDFFNLVDRRMSIEQLETRPDLSHEQIISLLNSLRTQIICIRTEIKVFRIYGELIQDLKDLNIWYDNCRAPGDIYTEERYSKDLKLIKKFYEVDR